MLTFFKKLLKTLGYTIALFIIIAATLISATELFIPYLNKYTSHFEKIASDMLEKPVKIKHLDISWHRISPTLIFEQVIIDDNNNKTSPFKIDAVQVRLEILKSLWERKPILAYVKIKGVDILAREDVHDKISVEGMGIFSTRTNVSAKPNDTDFNSLIYAIPMVEVEAVNIHYTLLEGPSYSVTLNRVSLENKELKHILRGKIRLNQELPSGLTFNFRWRGDLKEFDKISAKVYLYLEAIHLPQWLSDKTWQQIKIKEGLGSAKIRAAWSEGNLQRIQSQFQIYDLEIYSLLTKKNQLLNRLNGRINWKREEDTQVIEGEDILIDLPGHLWPTTHFYFKLPITPEAFDFSITEKFPAKPLSLSFSKNLTQMALNTPLPSALQSNAYQMQAKIGYLNLKDLTDIARMTDALPESIGNMLFALNPRGEISNLEIDMLDSHAIENNTVAVTFKNVSFAPWQSLPGLQNISGKLAWDGQKGRFDIDSQNMAFTYPSLLTKPLVFKAFQTAADLSKDGEDKFLISVDQFKFNNALDVNGKLSIEWPLHDTPFIDLEANFKMSDTRLLREYLILKPMDRDLKKWLQQAFEVGQISQGRFILNGRLQDFPFENNKGKFLVSIDLENLTFNYAPEWPAMVNTKGNVSFEGSAMHVRVDSSKVLNIPISHALADIPSLGTDKPETLLVKVPAIQSNLKDAFELIYQSPLKNKLGKALQNVELIGPATLDLALEVPLKTPEDTKVIGDISMKNAKLHLKSFGAEVSQLTGNLQFRENGISSETIKGNFYNQPFTIKFNTTHKTPTQSTIQAAIASRISSNVILQWTQNNPAIQKIIQGTTPFTAEVLVDTSSHSPTTNVILQSNLQGMAIDLPLNYGKKANESIDFRLNVDMKQDSAINAKVIFGKNFSFAATLKNSEKSMNFYSGELRLGNIGTANFQSVPGLLVSGKLRVFNWNEVQAYLQEAKKTASSDTNSQDIIKYLREMQFNIDQVKGLGIKLTRLTAKVTQDSANWFLSLNSSELAGEMNIPKSFGNSINAKFKYINLIPANDSTKSKTSLNPKDVPPLLVLINDFRFGGKSLGRINFNLEPNGNGISIKTFRADSPYFNLNATGQWTQGSTRLQGNLNTKNIANFVTYYTSTPSNIVGSMGTLTYDLTWPGAPHDVSLANVSGNATIKLTRGQIIGLDQATSAKMGFGRILNFLSIDSLWRRFSLNFSDLFEKGFPFDSLTGSFTLKKGNAFTENARLEGPLAKIELKGRIGLAAKDYDATLSVTPYVTRSIPVVAALAVNPLVGAAAWAVEKVASSAVSNATTQKYVIQGPWAKPVWKEK